MTQGRSISPREFTLFQTLIRREAGIHLSQAKRDLLVNRLSPRLRELGLQSFEDYYRIADSDDEERVRMLDRIATNETQFFREPRHFEYLEEHVYPAMQRRAELGESAKRVRIWSAACSTGEEPYSIAMSLLAHFSASWELHILATDLSTRVLKRAEEAIWPLERSAQIPAGYLKTYMLRGERSQEGKMKAGPELRALVETRRFNLNEEHYPFREHFDIIFCRNVLIYFDVPQRRHVVERLTDCLARDGLLFLGHAETANGLGLQERLRVIMPTVYTKVK